MLKGLKKRHVYVRTFGCQMNVHDSEQMIALLGENGYAQTEDPRRADVILLNTCSIREKADQKAFSQLGRYASFKRGKPGLILGVTGCVSQQMGPRIFDRIPEVDLVVGTHNIDQLPVLIGQLEEKKGRIAETAFRDCVASIGVRARPKKGSVGAFVTIMQGCDNYCAYCVVPYVRGRERSRGLDDIVGEIRFLAESGVKEVTLLGQNVNSYGRTIGNGASFPALIRAVAAVDGIKRIRFTTSHPKDLSDGLIGCFGTVGKLCAHIHLPVQAGSDPVLERMNRGYTATDYREKVRRLRETRPDIAVTSDMIVGFPGETEEDFRKTLELMEAVKFDGLFSFRYSEREETAAVSLPGKVEEGVKRERLHRLQKLQDAHTAERNRRLEGKRVTVLVEGPSKNSRQDMTGRTSCNRIVNFPGGNSLVGRTVTVGIRETYLHSLRGELEGEG
ncbi:MAG: (Dimethylallyl)adenosine tRNA methylthiotransferase MiaB [Syntrophaceae bacterium PtaU1.Bin231]|nr:MAG: (Dimethylallyl)adenosine tRNA methylthiotransferase MiaB [Syntrophaceae bacterium PtaU1.Bin231]